MAKKMLIDATHAEETRVVVVDGNKVEEFDFESENKRQLAGNIYLAKVTRVEPSLQAAFVDYGGNRHGFLAFSEIHPDYYQIPVADREALMEEERAYAEAQRAREEDEEKPKKRSRSRSRSSAKAEKTESGDATVSQEVAESDQIEGMETIDLGDEGGEEGSSPMMTVRETPVEEPEETSGEDTAARSEDGSDEDAGDDDGDDDARSGRNRRSTAGEKDSEIESVADDDDHEDIRPPRKPRPKRYKIQEVIKVRQILLVQVVKEERGNKGAALTTYLSLAGRYCVLMPNTARGGGISRKITNAADRKKLKEIATEIDVPSGAGLIVRTAGAKRTKSEIKRDYEYLQRLWEQIRELTLQSIAPAKIYEEGDLIKRSIRDLYSREIDEVLVEGERGYRNAKDFMKMIMPSHAKNVKHYNEQLPLFARFQVESYLAGMFNPTVQLKSGGYIVIGVTEALVAIDVNSGRATKEGSIEETATKTNLEAAEEVARQLRLRDLAGLIVIDFIDMDERKNNAAVEKKLKDKLKTDRARIQVGRISGFGLLEMSRQRLRPGMIEATTQPCHACHGTGLIRSDDSMALSILRQIEEEGTRRRSREVLVKAPVGIANYLMNQKREHVAQIEGRYGLSVRIEGQPHLVSPDFEMEKFKTATRKVPEAAPVVSVDTSLMEDIDDEVEAEAREDEAREDEAQEKEQSPSQSGGQSGGQSRPEAGEGEEQPKKKRRRRRRRRKSSRSDDGSGDDNMGSGDDQVSGDDSTEGAVKADDVKPGPTGTDAAEDATAEPTAAGETAAAQAEAPAAAPTEADAPEERPQAAAPEVTAPEAGPVAEDATPAKVAAEETSEAEAPAKEAPAEEPSAKPAAEETVREDAAGEDTAKDEAAKDDTGAADTSEKAPTSEATSEPEASPEPVMAEESAEPEEPAKPKKRGWWSLGS
ncbi:MAG: Rne/Rng family ribonuclease [Rhodobacteraceae bacterium]|nr:Rne/Rng family ribonuclease [Paracoccaceae bacterium]MBR9821883.1 Rne/Rng family ribonuclease [Paracoccaceae bacterium]